MKRYSVITKTNKSGWQLLLVAFLLMPFFTDAQIVVTMPGPGCNAASTYNQTGMVNGKPRYLGSQEFPFEILWTGTRWECRFVNNAELRFSNTSNTLKPPCGEWINDGICRGPNINIVSVDGVSCCSDQDGDGANAMTCGGTDCDDNDPLEKPGQIWYADTDNDGYSNGDTWQQCLRPWGYKVAAELISTSGDCNDGNAAVYPGASETCNGLDDNCNSIIDEGASFTFYRDLDGDGFGNPLITQQACSAPSGYVANSMDCDDANGAIHPNTVWYLDADNDHYYTGTGITQCSAPGAGYKYTGLTGANDCNDADAIVYPGAPDVCDSKDNNCNGTTDEGAGNTFPGWGAGNIGNATNTGSSFSCSSGSSSGTLLSVSSQGFSGAANADLIFSNYQQRCGDVVFTAHIAASPAPGWAGIYIRESLDPGSKMVAFKTNLSSFLRREVRTTTNGNKTTSQNPLYASNTWLRIERVGNAFNFYTSATGATWTFVFTATVAMNTCAYLGIFAESINAATTVTASFDNVTITGGTTPLAVHPDGGADIHEAPIMDLTVYPNPSSGDLFLKVENPDLYGQQLHVRMLNSMGSLLWDSQLESTGSAEALPGLPDLPDGVYWVQVQAPGFVPQMMRVVMAQ